MQAPWTDIGRLESDVREIKSQTSQMAKAYEVSQISRNVDSLKCELQTLSTVLDGLRYELQTVQEEVIILTERMEEK